MPPGGPPGPHSPTKAAPVPGAACLGGWRVMGDMVG